MTKEQYYARLQLLMFFHLSESYVRVVDGALEFDLSKEEKRERPADLEVFFSFIKDYRTELARVKEAAEKLIAAKCPVQGIKSAVKDFAIDVLANTVKNIRQILGKK